MSSKLDTWKKTRPVRKTLKEEREYSCMISTALCMLFAPSGPRRARPGPNIVQKVAIVTVSSSQPIATTVVSR